MSFKDAPIRRKLITMILLTSGVVLMLTCTAFFAYEFLTFRQATLRNLSTLGKIVAANSTAALAFDNQDDAREILSALRVERHVVSAGLYDQRGHLFASYPADLRADDFPAVPEGDGYRFGRAYLTTFQPVVEGGGNRLGTLYLKSDMRAMYRRIRLYATIAAAVIAASFLVAYLLSRVLQEQVSRPILALAKTAKIVSARSDYTVRATKYSDDELGVLTDAFNQMLTQIHEQDQALRANEARLRELSEDLERRVIERTAQLEAVNRELESFCYSVSHDLRAPLRGIDGYSRLLLEDYADKLDEEGRTFVNNVRQGVQQTSILIDDLLAYSRMERRALQNNPVDLSALVRAAVAECAEGIRARGAEVRVDLPPLTARADPDGLTIVLRNLLENALKFTGEVSVPVIEIGGHAEGTVATLWVRDNGIGFDMKFHDRIFEIFQRLQRAEDYPGTGIGLAMVRKAMQRMGGRVWAESQPGQGATFYLELPS